MTRNIIFVAALVMLVSCATDKSGYTVDRSGVSPGVNIVDRTGGDAPLPGGGQRKLLKMVPPNYPANLRRANVKGVVAVMHTVMPDGSIERVAIQQSAGDQLDKLALAAVAQWRYEPYTPVDGKLLSFVVPVTFNNH